MDARRLPHPNMMNCRTDGRRLYVSNCILSPLDADQRFGIWLPRVGPEGMSVDEDFRPDFRDLPDEPAGPHDTSLE